MRYFHHGISLKSLIIGFVTIIAILFIYEFIDSTIGLEIGEKRCLETTRNYAMWEGDYDIYNMTGRMLSSLNELEKSDYFPFVNNSQIAAINHITTLSTSYSASNDRVQGNWTWRIGNGPLHSGQYIRKNTYPTKEQQTERYISWLLCGVHERKCYLELMRDHFSHAFIVFNANPAKLPHFSSDLLNNLHQATYNRSCSIQGDLPKNEHELTEYLHWLCATEGVNTLTDAWNHPLVFSLQNTSLTGLSAGPDQKFHTNDDIKVTVDIRHPGELVYRDSLWELGWQGCEGFGDSRIYRSNEPSK